MVADIREKLKIYDSHLCGKLWLAGEKVRCIKSASTIYRNEYPFLFL